MADESKDGGVASKALINDPATAVTEMIDGFLLMNPQLTRLDGFEKVSGSPWHLASSPCGLPPSCIIASHTPRDSDLGRTSR